MNLPASGVPGDLLPTRSRRRPLRALAAILAAVCCLAVAIYAGTAAHAELARKPTPAGLSPAAAAAVAGPPRAPAPGPLLPPGRRPAHPAPCPGAARPGGVAPPAPRAHGGYARLRPRPPTPTPSP